MTREDLLKNLQEIYNELKNKKEREELSHVIGWAEFYEDSEYGIDSFFKFIEDSLEVAEKFLDTLIDTQNECEKRYQRYALTVYNDISDIEGELFYKIKLYSHILELRG